MQSTISHETQIDELLKRGLRNRWYPLIPSRLVKADPLGVRRAGESLVIWRDNSGNAHVQSDACPHRRAPLSLGIHGGDRLICRYHGLEIGPDGTVLRVPAVTNCALEGRKAVRTFPVRERAGAVYGYFGDALHPNAPELVLPDELVSSRHSHFLCYVEWKAPLCLLIDNIMDPMHGAYLHAQSHSMSKGERNARMEIVETPSGFLFRKQDQKDVNYDWVEWGDTGTFWMRLEIPYPLSAGPGGNFGIVVQGTPIDANSTACFFWRIRKVEGWQRDVWRFLYKNRLEGHHWNVVEQDRVVLEAMCPDQEAREFLYEHDLGLAKVRQMMRREAKRQVAALAAHALDRANASDGAPEAIGAGRSRRKRA